MTRDRPPTSTEDPASTTPLCTPLCTRTLRPDDPCQLRLSWPGLLILLGALLLLAGCAAPIGADFASQRRAYAHLHEDALTSSRLSSETTQVLQRHGLSQSFRDDPDTALARLHQQARKDGRRDLLHALSELSYHRAEKLSRSVKPWEPRHSSDHYLASAIYAYLYLFGDGPEAAPSFFDLRFRRARELYNRGLALGLVPPGQTNGQVRLRAGSRDLLPGPVQLQYDRPDLPWNPDWIEEFHPADSYIVRGLSTRNRTAGLGSPLIAVLRQPGHELPKNVPLTLFLRLEGDIHDWNSGTLPAALELYSAFDTESVQVNGQTLPLQTDLTAPLAHALNNELVWELGLEQFLSPEKRVAQGIMMTQPYVPGRIPVVFVHGTASSPIWWAEMLNTLRADDNLHHRYQFWTFNYNSGNPISYSAGLLRQGLTNAVHSLDPDGKDPALRQMVVVGHSQGGLLTKLTATDTGDKLWRLSSDKSLDELAVSDDLRETLRATYFQKPLPCVKRVVFIATPHRGSYRATRFARNILRHLISLPADVTQTATTLFSQLNKETRLQARLRRRVPTSVDSMSPNNQYLLTLAAIPVGPEIKAHSIIAIKGDDQPPEGADGLVKYRSAHQDYADSEFIVRHRHTCQNHPFTIEEVRRILLEHLSAVPAAAVAASEGPEHSP